MQRRQEKRAWGWQTSQMHEEDTHSAQVIACAVVSMPCMPKTDSHLLCTVFSY